MNNVVEEILKQFPSAAAIIYVVVHMLSSMNKRDQMFHDRLKEVSDNCHDIQEKAINAMNKNSDALASFKEVVRSMIDRV
jgi:hypothetical protein